MRPVIADAIARAGDGCDRIYVSVDIDVLDPGFAPGTGTPEPGGMNPADLLRAVRSIALETPLVALDVVEVGVEDDPRSGQLALLMILIEVRRADSR